MADITIHSAMLASGQPSPSPLSVAAGRTVCRREHDPSSIMSYPKLIELRTEGKRNTCGNNFTHLAKAESRGTPTSLEGKSD